jgi:hypothetical protein
LNIAKNGIECQEEKATRYEGRLWANIADDNYQLKCCMKERNSKITLSGETVEKVKMAILPIYESLKIKNLQTAKDHKMASSRVFRQSRKEAVGDTMGRWRSFPRCPYGVYLASKSGVHIGVHHSHFRCPCGEYRGE